jgi:4-carboxymuconolactone decarboxylase
MSQPTTHPRIQPVAEPLPEPLASHMARLLPPGMPAPQLFLSVARNAGLFGFMVESGLIGPTGLLDRRSLPKDVREALILRTCVATRNDYEFNLHVQTISARMGLSAAQIEDIKLPAPTPALWRADQLALVQLIDALVRTLAVPDDVYAKAREQFSEAQLIELTQLVGLYTGVAMLVGLIRPQFDRYQPGPAHTVAPRVSGAK